MKIYIFQMWCGFFQKPVFETKLSCYVTYLKLCLCPKYYKRLIARSRTVKKYILEWAKKFSITLIRNYNNTEYKNL